MHKNNKYSFLMRVNIIIFVLICYKILSKLTIEISSENQDTRYLTFNLIIYFVYANKRSADKEHKKISL